MKEKLDRILVVLVISIFFFSGCESSFTPVEKHINEDKIEAKSSSVKKENVDIKRIEGKLKAAANIVKVAIQNSHFRNELHRILKFYSNQENRFDAVSFAELESSKALHRNENYQGNISSNKARSLIKNSFKKDELNNKDKTKSLNKFLVEDLANLYMPNLSDWDGKEIPTITWHPLDDEESSNVGFEPVLNSEKSKVQGWKKVTVDKKYGEKNPVLIIMPGKSFSYAPANIEAGINSSDEVELSYIEPCKDCGGGGSGNTGDNEEKKTTSYSPACEDENCDGPLEVQIGWVELNSYPCGWFCSGRRIYFAHQEAYQTLEDSPVTVETRRSSVYMDSGDRGNWIRYYTQFDHNWPSYQLSKQLKIYIGRGGGFDSVIEGAYNLLKEPDDVINIAYDTYLKLTAKDLNRDVFLDGLLDRGTFVSSNKSSFGHGTKEGYRIYRVDNSDGSHIRYTLPHNKY